MKTIDLIRSAIATSGSIAIPMDQVAGNDNLYRLGLTSHASVNVMLTLEETFSVEFPDQMLTKRTFETLDSISAALAQLGVTDVAMVPGTD
jgi:acyl carrier protein